MKSSYMDRPYEIVEVGKGSDEWLTWRHLGIGKADAAGIMGVALEIPGTLLNAKKRDKPRKPMPTPEEEEGGLLEPEARELYEDRFGREMPATCVQSTKYPWLKASLDGLSEDGSSVLEICCGRKTYGKTKSLGRPPKYIWPQLQHILAVTGLRSIDFVCYRPSSDLVVKRVERDDEYIGELIDKEWRFWGKVCQHKGLSLGELSLDDFGRIDSSGEGLDEEDLSNDDGGPDDPCGDSPFAVDSKLNEFIRDDYDGEDDFMRPKVYVLELEGGYYYVGKCKNFPERVRRHIDGTGSLWTKLHRPVASVAFYWGDEEVEKSVTLHYMNRYGINRVRGWVFAKGGDYDESRIRHKIGQLSEPTPFDQLQRCTSLSPMRLNTSPAWEVNSKDLDPGDIISDERPY